MKSEKIPASREFEISDLRWIEPIARKYGEWDGFVHTLIRNEIVSMRVIPGKCVAAIIKNENGRFYGCGLSDRDGIKQLIRLGRMMAGAAGRAGMKLHRNETGGWQNKLLDQLGLEKADVLSDTIEKTKS